MDCCRRMSTAVSLVRSTALWARVDETGFLKHRGGKATVLAGNSWPMARRGAAFLDRELYLPQEWAGLRRQEAGVPEGVAFRTKAQLARDDRPRGGGWRALCLGNWGYGVRQ